MVAEKTMDIAWIRNKIVENNYEFTAHAEEERQADKLMVQEIEKALLQGELLESYPDDPRGESCLVHTHSAQVGR